MNKVIYPRIVRSTDEHGGGSDAVWNDDFHHALRVALTGDRHEYYANYTGATDVATAWDRRWVYSGQYSAGFDRRHGAHRHRNLRQRSGSRRQPA